MTPEIMRRVDASRARMVDVLERLHAERDPDCPLCGTYGCVGAGDEPPADTPEGTPPSFQLEKTS